MVTHQYLKKSSLKKDLKILTKFDLPPLYLISLCKSTGKDNSPALKKPPVSLPKGKKKKKVEKKGEKKNIYSEVEKEDSARSF